MSRNILEPRCDQVRGEGGVAAGGGLLTGGAGGVFPVGGGGGSTPVTFDFGVAASAGSSADPTATRITGRASSGEKLAGVAGAAALGSPPPASAWPPAKPATATASAAAAMAKRVRVRAVA